jgi:hypothetical protein
MTTLPDEKIKEIAEDVAKENAIPIQGVSTTAAIDSAGLEAVEVVISITPETSFQIMGERSARTVFEIHRRLSNAGEERMPIVWFGEKRAP